MFRLLLLVAFLVKSSLALAAQPNPKTATAYAELDEKWQPYSGQFKQILNESFKRLQSWNLQTSIKSSNGQTVEEILNGNRKGKHSGVVIASLKETKSKSSGWFSSSEEQTTLEIKLYDKTNNNLIVSVKKQFKKAEPSALFANLESELPHTLKIKLAEVGSVIKKSSELVYFNLGSSSGIKVGSIYKTFKPGEKLINKDGDTFGWIENTTGIVKVIHSQSTYSTAEILLGRLSIDENDFIELAEDQNMSAYEGKIISVLEDQVAIGLGETVGVTDGSFYAVFKDIKTIKDSESFREKLGEIRIHTVHKDFSVGELSLSSHYELSKALIKESDPIEEINPNNLDLLSLGQMGTNTLSSSSSDNIIMAAYQVESQDVSGMIYRYRGGYGSDFMLSAGIMSSINHSPNFFYGLEGVYLDGVGANFFLSVDVPTPVKTVKVNMETGYLAGVGDAYEGFNLSINIKYPLDNLF